jgi:RNA polymerase sigma-70 factor, ECF subfamily
VVGFRLIFMLREVEELSADGTAPHLGLRQETVKTHLHRGRRRLREALDTELADVMVRGYPVPGARCERITRAVLGRVADARRSRPG